MKLKQIIKNALSEDRAFFDITSLNIKYKKKSACFYIIAKEKGILCGVQIAAKVFKEVSSNTKVEVLAEDGCNITVSDKIMKISGSPYDILATERTALNFLSHLSGISTYTQKFVKLVKSVNPYCDIYDTRKTLPGLREIEKYAVKVGGGKNHRFNLSEFILLKENHLSASGKSIKEIISDIKQKKTIIEIEVQNLSELKEALACDVDIIMLDNFTLENIKKAQLIIKNLQNSSVPLLEVSGGVNLKNVAEIAACGIKRISIGAITNSAKAIDFTLLYEK